MQQGESRSNSRYGGSPVRELGQPVSLVRSGQDADALYVSLMTYLQGAVPLRIISWDFPEGDESDSLLGLATRVARNSSLGLYGPVLVAYDGLFVPSLGGFPGALTLRILQKVGPTGVIRLLLDAPDRSATRVIVLAFCTPGMSPMVFHSSIKGSIREEVRRNEGEGPVSTIFQSAVRRHEVDDRAPTGLEDNPLRSLCLRFAEWYGKGERSGAIRLSRSP